MYGQNPLGSTGSAGNAEAFANLFLAYCLRCAHFANHGPDVLEHIDLYFRGQFNFRCYQVADPSELQPYRECLSAALCLLSDTRPEVVLYLMHVLKRKDGSTAVLSGIFRKLFR